MPTRDVPFPAVGNVSVDVIGRGFAYDQGASLAPSLHYDFTNVTLSSFQSRGPTLDLTRATEATVTDYFNVIKTVNDGEARYTGGRRVENGIKQSNTFNDAEWTDSDVTFTSGQSEWAAMLFSVSIAVGVGSEASWWAS